jgi:hypothetical protein
MAVNQATVARELPPKRGGIWLGLLAALFLLGAIALIYSLANDEAEIDFALFTVSFLYLMGVSQGAIVFCAIMRLVGAQWAKPYYRLAELTALAFAPFAIVVFLILFFAAQDDLFYWLRLEGEAAEDAHLSSWLNINWLLIRNLGAMVLFYGLSLVYALKALKPDLAARSGSTVDETAHERSLFLMSPFIILAFVLTSTLFAWDFGMMLIEHWHTTVFPIFFSFGNLFAGSAALVFFAAALGRGPGSRFGADQIRCLGMVITGFTVLWLYFFWSQFFVVWFGNLPRETDALWPQMYGHYAPYYWSMMAGCFFIPFAALVFAYVKRSIPAMCVLAAGINIGVWLHKYLTVVPALAPDDTPFDQWLDVILAVGLAAGFLAVLVALLSRLPRYSNWEIERSPVRRR